MLKKSQLSNDGNRLFPSIRAPAETLNHNQNTDQQSPQRKSQRGPVKCFDTKQKYQRQHIAEKGEDPRANLRSQHYRGDRSHEDRSYSDCVDVEDLVGRSPANGVSTRLYDPLGFRLVPTPLKWMATLRSVE